MSDPMAEFKGLFLQTARERIQTLSNLLLKLESETDTSEIVQELMRTGHSLKGESGAMGYTEIASLAHIVEDLFMAIGDGKMSISSQVIDALLSSLDVISESLSAIETNNTELSLQDQIAQLKQLTGLETEGFGKSAPDHSSQTNQQVNSASPASPNQIVTTATKDPTNPSDSPKITKTAEKITAVTIKTDKLDQMVGLTEELVLLKMKLKTNKLVDTDANLKAEIHRLDRLVTDLQFHIMQARLFPISLALATLPRLVRDTAKKTNKKVRLELEGEDTTVDRTIIDHLSEPFVHMIRNSIDHGIEEETERINLGKNPEAFVKIKAYTKENKFFIEISDDGRGIEWDKVVSAAIKKGYVTKEETKNYSQKQIEELLYRGGVSTNEVITDVSGRGVGMAAIKEAIKKLGGSIDIQSIVGKGTTFVIRLPLTLAIMQALLVSVSQQTYALPGNEVIRSIQVPSSKISRSANTSVIVVDQIRIPIVDLYQLFKLSSHQENSSTKTGSIDDQLKTVILLKQDQDVIGCLVDKILSEEEILVKPLGHLLKKAIYFSGTTILADGSAAPIINVEGLSWKHQTI